MRVNLSVIQLWSEAAQSDHENEQNTSQRACCTCVCVCVCYVCYVRVRASLVQVNESVRSNNVFRWNYMIHHSVIRHRVITQKHKNTQKMFNWGTLPSVVFLYLKANTLFIYLFRLSDVCIISGSSPGLFVNHVMDWPPDQGVSLNVHGINGSLSTVSKIYCAINVGPIHDKYSYELGLFGE